MGKKDMVEGFLMQWAIYFAALYAAVIISNLEITLTATIVICAPLSFLAAIVTTIIFLAENRRLTAK
jgi:hypothetical protein